MTAITSGLRSQSPAWMVASFAGTFSNRTAPVQSTIGNPIHSENPSFTAPVQSATSSKRGPLECAVRPHTGRAQPALLLVLDDELLGPPSADVVLADEPVGDLPVLTAGSTPLVEECE